MIDMWEKVFTEEVLNNILRILGNDDATEDMKTLKDAIEHFSANFCYDLFLSYADGWYEKTTIEQVDFAISEVGEEYASRFIIIMDYIIMHEDRKVGNDEQ